MRPLLAALALAGALHSFASISAAQPARVAQMSRDVTDAVRKQRAEAREQPRRPTRHPCEGVR
jgi:hypothetical protein